MDRNDWIFCRFIYRLFWESGLKLFLFVTLFSRTLKGQERSKTNHISLQDSPDFTNTYEKWNYLVRKVTVIAENGRDNDTF